MTKIKSTLVVTDTEIIMVRGDAVELDVQLFDDSDGKQAHEMQEGETLTLTVRKNPKGSDEEEPLISITSEEPSIRIPASATENLPYGAYSADIEFSSPRLASPVTIWPHRAPYDMARFGALKNFIIGTEIT